MALSAAPVVPADGAEISIAVCALDADQDMGLAAAWPLLSAEETTRAQRFHFDRDRDRYVRARGFLRVMLGRACGLPAGRLVFGTGPHGKPFLRDMPLAFNLSHSRDLAVLAIAHSQHGDQTLGIDLEFIDREVDIAGLAQTCLTAHEATVLAALPDAERAPRFFAFWTAKEALMKLTGQGMSLPPHQIALDLRFGLPVGYLAPKLPAAQAVFLDLGRPAAMCCLALAQGPKPCIVRLL